MAFLEQTATATRSTEFTLEQLAVLVPAASGAEDFGCQTCIVCGGCSIIDD
jgi:hypothetical protein